MTKCGRVDDDDGGDDDAAGLRARLPRCKRLRPGATNCNQHTKQHTPTTHTNISTTRNINTNKQHQHHHQPTQDLYFEVNSSKFAYGQAINAFIVFLLVLAFTYFGIMRPLQHFTNLFYPNRWGGPWCFVCCSLCVVGMCS